MLTTGANCIKSVNHNYITGNGKVTSRPRDLQGLAQYYYIYANINFTYPSLKRYKKYYRAYAYTRLCTHMKTCYIAFGFELTIH